ncbi:MAG: glycosyltransferase family A protein [Patescibacteria group bacterium]|nr:glycosyltransferase family A protein [Patescibacteria group bacterium]
MNKSINQPLVSILNVTYNAEKFIKPTFDSLINQEYSNTEILILDNNSQDKTSKILKEYEKKFSNIKTFLGDKNLGPYRGLNFLLNKAKGKYISITDHDDIYHPQKISKQVDFLSQNKKFVGCGTNLCKYFEKDSTFKYVKIKKQGTFAAHPSLVFRNKQGLKYNTKVKYKTDTYFMKYILCKKKPLLYNIQEPLYLSRVRTDKRNLSYLWNEKLTFNEIWSYFDHSNDKKALIKFMFKKILNYNFFKNIFSEMGKESLNSLKNGDFFQDYLQYLK